MASYTGYLGLALLLTLLYNDWVFGPLFNPHMSPSHSLISELSAVSQPNHAVFQTMDICAGLLTLVFVGFVWKITSGLSKRERYLLTGLYAFIGVDSIVDASLPISCAPSMDAQCNLLSTHSVLTQSHLIESNIAGIAAAVTPVVWWLRFRFKDSAITQASFWFFVIQVTAGIGIIVIKLSGKDNYGMFQRVYESGLGIWVGTIAFVSYTWAPVKKPEESYSLKPSFEELRILKLE